MRMARQMNRQIALVGAASNLGIKTYDDGRPRAVDRAPMALRTAGLTQRLAVAQDLGDVPSGPYHQFARLPGRIHHEPDLARYCRRLAKRVSNARRNGWFPLVVGGDCSVLLASLLAVRSPGRGARGAGLVYLDGHADFATPDESATGSAASMVLALATGRAAGMPGTLDPDAPLVSAADVALIGRRDEEEPWYGQDALPEFGVLDLPDRSLRATGGYAQALDQILDRVAEAPGGFWIHLDVDVIDSTIMSAVDSPAPGGAQTSDLALLLAGLVAHPQALGMDVTIYDPALDLTGRCRGRLVDLLGIAFEGAAAGRPREKRHDR
jgi:arginase